jgi:hypothetical protein
MVLYIFSIFFSFQFFSFYYYYYFFFPLVRQWQSYYSNTNTKTGCWRSNTRTIKTKTLLHLNLGFIFSFSVFFFLFLCLSNACLVHSWLVHYCWSEQWDRACVIWYLALWESSKELRQRSQDQMSRKTTVLKVPQMASCPSDVNKKVMLTVCFSCLSVPILKEI